jgi:hypothetical protein
MKSNAHQFSFLLLFTSGVTGGVFAHGEPAADQVGCAL